MAGMRVWSEKFSDPIKIAHISVRNVQSRCRIPIKIITCFYLLNLYRYLNLYIFDFMILYVGTVPLHANANKLLHGGSANSIQILNHPIRLGSGSISEKIVQVSIRIRQKLYGSWDPDPPFWLKYKKVKIGVKLRQEVRSDTFCKIK